MPNKHQYYRRLLSTGVKLTCACLTGAQGRIAVMLALGTLKVVLSGGAVPMTTSIPSPYLARPRDSTSWIAASAWRGILGDTLFGGGGTAFNKGGAKLPSWIVVV